MTWNWSAFWGYLGSPLIINGAITTVWLTIASMALSIVIGLLWALAYQTGSPIVRGLYWLYVTLIRGTPLLLQLVFIYTVLPLAGIKLSLVESALLGLCLNEGAYDAEIIRSGLESIPVGQREAARASGFTYWQTEVLIVVPQAMRVVIPTIGNQVNSMFKYTSLVSVISMTELFRVTEELSDATFQYLEIYAVAASYYLAMTFAWTLVQRWIERFTTIPGSQAHRLRATGRRRLRAALVAGWRR